jgi:hypothetical protein
MEKVRFTNNFNNLIILTRKSKSYGKGQGLPIIYTANQVVKLKIKSARSTKAEC